MHGETAPKIHRHIEGEEEKELLPWFMIAVRLNPRHIEAWRAGAYWFYRTGDSEHAIEFIREGISNNPKEYRLHLDLGILMYRLRDWPEALKSLETAESLWEESSEDAEFDLRAIRSYIKYIKERN